MHREIACTEQKSQVRVARRAQMIPEYLITFVVVPDAHLTEVPETEDIRIIKNVHLVPLKLVGLIGLLQSQSPRVSALSEDTYEYIGVRSSACTEKMKGRSTVKHSNTVKKTRDPCTAYLAHILPSFRMLNST